MERTEQSRQESGTQCEDAAADVCRSCADSLYRRYHTLLFCVCRHVSHIGAITSLIFHPTQPSAIVSTLENVLASLSLSGSASGETQWRQVLPAGERVTDLSSYSATRVLAVCASSAADAEHIATVRMFNSKDGSLVWDAPVADSSAEATFNETNSIVQQQKRRIQAQQIAQPYNRFDFTHSDIAVVADVTADGKRDIAVLHGNQGRHKHSRTQTSNRKVRLHVMNVF